MKAFDLEVKPPGGAVMDISLHQYVFNYSEHSKYNKISFTKIPLGDHYGLNLSFLR